LHKTIDDGSASIRSHPNKKPMRASSDGMTPGVRVPWFVRSNESRDELLQFVGD
jgi:hypothetical protein